MQSDIVLIEAAEAHFLSGDFQKSLLASNQLLSKITPEGSLDNGAFSSVFPLKSQLCLSIDPNQQERRIGILVPHPDTTNGPPKLSLVERAATVALQSWYEIANDAGSRRPDQSTAEQGYTHLLPFFRVYTCVSPSVPKNHIPTNGSSHEDALALAMDCRPMPLELAVVFIQFLQSGVCGHSREAVELGGEILFRVAAKSHPGRQIRVVLEELYCLLMVEILPLCASPGTVVAFLKRFLQHGEAWKPSKDEFLIRKQPSSDVVVLILSFLNSAPPRWSHQRFPSKECVDGCRSSLREMLKLVEMQRRRRQAASEKSLESPSRSHLTFLENEEVVTPNREALSGTSPGPDPLVLKNKIVSSEGALLKASRGFRALVWKFNGNWGGLAFLLVMALFAWKRRHRTASVSAAAFRLFLAPFREVVDALIKPS